MDSEQIFQQLENAESAILINLLEKAYDVMNTNQRRKVFDHFVQSIPLQIKDSKALLKEVEKFQKDSLKRKYYAPFIINSKNYMDVPEKTEEWFENLGDLLKNTTNLSKNGEHSWAIQCFKILYSLIDRMERGEEIIFADEYGAWMIPGEETDYITAYLTSLASTSNPEDFVESVIPLLKRDSSYSFSKKVYPSVLRVATHDQIDKLKTEIKSQKIKISSKS